MNRYTLPLTIAAAILCAAYAITSGIMQTIDPRPGGLKLAVVCACLTVFWTGVAILIRREHRRQR
jgi:hypothetical protein